MLSLVTAGGLLVFILYQTLTEVKSPASTCPQESGPLPRSVVVEGCTSAPCDVRQGEDAVLNITSISPRNTSTLTTVATAHINTFWGITIPIRCDLGNKSDACSFLTDSACPVPAGALVKYTLRIPIPTSIPRGIAPTVEFSVVDDHQLPLTCVRVPIKVRSMPDDQAKASVLENNVIK